MRKKCSKEDYFKGSPELNLNRNERKLLISALITSRWDVLKALKLNFPRESITPDGYYKLLKKHHISPRDKTYKKLIEIE